MKIAFLLTAMLGLCVLCSGCATPAYSGGLPTLQFPEEKPTGENANMVLRNWHYENRQMIDDLQTFLLMNPASKNTKWNVR